jgi:hypothetical protein
MVVMLYRLKGRYPLALLPHALHRSVADQALLISFWKQPTGAARRNSPATSLQSELEFTLNTISFCNSVLSKLVFLM